MAKRKGSVALFEVIHRDKRFAKPNPSALSTPSWWFKGKQPAAPASQAAPASPPLSSVMSVAPLAFVQPQAEPEQTLGDPTQPVGQSPQAEGETAALTQDEKDSWPATPGAGGLGTMESAPRPHHFADEPGGPITWTSGVIIGATAVFVLGVGLILTHHPRQAAAGLADGGPKPDVMNVSTRHDNGGSSAGTGLIPVPENNAGQADQLPSARTRGYLYALIQWYPRREEAVAAAAILTENGVPNTIEQNLAKAPRGTYSVVGLDSFTHWESPQLEAYEAKIQAISDKFDANPKGWRAFQPVMFKWTKSEKSDSTSSGAAAGGATGGQGEAKSAAANP